MKGITILAVALVITVAPMRAVAAAESDDTSPLVAAGWCEIRRGGEDEAAQCDVGAGVELVGRDVGRHRVSAVAMIGSSTAGIGAAWTIKRRGPRSPSVSVGAGVTVPYDERGIDLAAWHPALGATFGW